MAVQRYKIRFGDVDGSLEFTDSAPVKFQVIHENPQVVERVRSHFTTPREFLVPESSRIDDFRRDFVEPVRDVNYFRQAMTELAAATDVVVLGR